MNDLFVWRAAQIKSLENTRISPAFNIGFDVSYGAHGRKIDPGKREKFVIFGLPRSGNTWLQTLLSHILDLEVIDPWSSRESGIGMCHRPLSTEVIERIDFVHAVCLIRDPRDIIASYFTFVQSEHWKAKSPWFHYFSEEQFVYDYFFPRFEGIYNIRNYWLEFSAFNLPLIRYESLQRAAKESLENLAGQLGLSFDSVRLEKALEATRMSEFKTKGVTGYEHIHPSHFGTGQIGSHKSILSDQTIKTIECRYSELLRRWNY